MIDWSKLNTSRDDVLACAKLANLAHDNGVPRDVLSLAMDIELAHSVTPMRLADMLTASLGDVLHDVCGIVTHLDRETGKLTDCFSPRFTA